MNNIQEALSGELGVWWDVHSSFGSGNNAIAGTAPAPPSSGGRGGDSGEDQIKRKNMPGTSSDSMTLPRVVSGDTHISVMN